MSREAKQRLAAGGYEGKDVWRDNIAPRDAVRARTIPLLEAERERLQNELAEVPIAKLPANSQSNTHVPAGAGVRVVPGRDESECGGKRRDRCGNNESLRCSRGGVSCSGLTGNCVLIIIHRCSRNGKVCLRMTSGSLRSGVPMLRPALSLLYDISTVIPPRRVLLYVYQAAHIY
jgi:hypothetical protein